MAELDRILEENRTYAASPRPDRDPAPSRRLAVVTCMDARIDPAAAFGIAHGDAHVLRNAGGRVSGDVLRSLAVSCHLLGVREVVVVHHTRCGMAASEDDLREQLERASGQPVDIDLRAIDDRQAALEADVERIRHHPLIPPDVSVSAAVYDVTSGRLEPVITGGG